MHAQPCNLWARTALAIIVFALGVPAGAARATGLPEPPTAPLGGAVEQGAAIPRQEAVAAPSEPVAAPSDIRNMNRELAAGRVPSQSSLHNLRKNVEELVPAVDALERHKVSGTGVPGGRARFERGLRRAVAGAVVLVAALVRSGADMTESERLLGLLRRLAGIARGARATERPGAAYAAPGAAAQQVAYTHAATDSHHSQTSSPSDVRPSVTIAPRQLAADLPPDLLSPARIARLATAAPRRSSSGWLAAAALLLTVAASGSFASIAMSRWGGARPTRRTRD